MARKFRKFRRMKRKSFKKYKKRTMYKKKRLSLRSKIRRIV